MIKNNNIINKFLPIVIFTISILFIFTINCFAVTTFPWTTYNNNIPKEIISIATTLEHYKEAYSICIFDYGLYSNCYRVCFLITQNSKIDISGGNTSKKYIYINSPFYCYDINKDDYNSISDSGLVNGSYHDSCKDSNFFFTGSDCTVIDSGKIFFQATPLQGVQVVEITQVQEIPKTIVETMKTIIPIGLLVLSVFLVIFLIRLVISRAI